MFTFYVKGLYQKLYAEDEQLDALFQYATEGIILTDDKGYIVLANPAAENIFGYNKGELTGKHIEALVPQRFNELHSRHREHFYVHPGHRRMGAGRDLFGKKKDGTEFPVEVSLSFFYQHKKFYVIAFVVDITLRKQTEQHLLQQKEALEKLTEEMRRMNQQLEQEVERRTQHLQQAMIELEKSRAELQEALKKEKELNEIKSRFVSMASHEFRTPLSTILSSASLIQRYTQETQQPMREKHVVRIKEAVSHMNDLLEDFLSLGRIEEGRVEVHKEPFALPALIEEIQEELQSLLKPGQHLIVNHSHIDILVSDKHMLKAILMNLLTNASKFSAPHKPIYLHFSVDAHQLQVSVRDEGIGIPEEEQHHLFSSFFRASNVTNIQGTGLGLHIVKRYIDLLGGRIQLKSQLQVGTEIIFFIPLNETDL
ncbi:MAG: PAS domain-containing sensor histidine kinase [Thermoflavifilum sp.]|nr:PAS domain-containing sensor histidine kinase [Thermoflavifilum sp.]